MKGIIIITFLILAAVNEEAAAQLIKPGTQILPKLHLPCKLTSGIDIAFCRLDYPTDTGIYVLRNTPLLSFNLNLDLEFKLSSGLVIALEPGLIQKGFNFNSDEVHSREMMNYVQLPVVLKGNIFSTVKLTGGFEWDHLINAMILSQKYLHVIHADFNKNDVALLGGIEYQFTDKWCISARYSHSLLSFRDEQVTDDHGYNTGMESHFYHRYFQLALFYNW
jgi:hypothetical protein